MDTNRHELELQPRRRQPQVFERVVFRDALAGVGLELGRANREASPWFHNCWVLRGEELPGGAVQVSSLAEVVEEVEALGLDAGELFSDILEYWE